MKIKNTAIIGAGAVGSYFIAGLQEKLGENLWIVAEGERRNRLLKEGILINEKKIDLNIKTAEEAAGADLLIIAVKYGALKSSISMIEKIVDDHTIVLCPMNGIDSEKIIGETIGMEHMVYSMIKIASHRIANQIVYDPEITQGIFYGEQDGSRSERILAIQELFADTEIHQNICNDIERDIWFKFALNISMNLPQAIVGCGVGSYTASKHMAFLCKSMREEVVNVAAAKGIDIHDDKNFVAVSRALSSNSRFSTLQDLDAGRETEIEMFSGALMKMGKELGVPTPFNEFAYHTIKALEEKNSGKIK